jgi:hypothetical protein
MIPASNNYFETLISKPRLASYHQYFKTKDINEAIGYYMWNCDLAANYSVLLGFFEILLRNKIHAALSSFYSRSTSQNIDWYNKFALKGRAQQQVNKILCDKHNKPLAVPPKPDEVVSRLTFGFWPALFNNIDQRYFDVIMPSVFSNHPLNSNPLEWKDKPKRRQALRPLFELNDFRNRIAHHEPLWKFSAVFDDSTGVQKLVHATTHSVSDSLSRLEQVLELLDSLIEHMAPAFLADFHESSWRKELKHLVSPNALQIYSRGKHAPTGARKPLLLFKKNFRLLVKAGQPLCVTKAGYSGVFYPRAK